MCAKAAIFEVFILNLQISKWRRDIENWLTSGMSCCTNTEGPKEIKQKKVEAILEHGSGDFLVGLIAYRGHFFLVCLKYQQVHFGAAVGALEKKSYFIFKESL